jgi:hypothetical protein
MTHYRIISVDPPGKVVDLAEADSAQAFSIAEELEASVVDILRDEKYAFSLRRLGGAAGYWALFQRLNLEPLRRFRERRLAAVERLPSAPADESAADQHGQGRHRLKP